MDGTLHRSQVLPNPRGDQELSQYLRVCFGLFQLDAARLGRVENGDVRDGNMNEKSSKESSHIQIKVRT